MKEFKKLRDSSTPEEQNWLDKILSMALTLRKHKIIREKSENEIKVKNDKDIV